MTANLEQPYLRINNNILLVADALLPPSNGDTKPVEGKYAILAKDLKGYWDRRQGVQIAQLYKLVIPGLILTKHIFRGLKRNLYDDDKKDGDVLKLIYSRTPSFDVELDKKYPSRPKVVKVDAPKGKVWLFVSSRFW